MSCLLTLQTPVTLHSALADVAAFECCSDGTARFAQVQTVVETALTEIREEVTKAIGEFARNEITHSEITDPRLVALVAATR